MDLVLLLPHLIVVVTYGVLREELFLKLVLSYWVMILIGVSR